MGQLPQGAKSKRAPNVPMGRLYFQTKFKYRLKYVADIKKVLSLTLGGRR